MLTDIGKYFSIIKIDIYIQMNAGALFTVGALWLLADGWYTSCKYIYSKSI